MKKKMINDDWRWRPTRTAEDTSDFGRCSGVCRVCGKRGKKLTLHRRKTRKKRGGKIERIFWNPNWNPLNSILDQWIRGILIFNQSELQHLSHFNEWQRCILQPFWGKIVNNSERTGKTIPIFLKFHKKKLLVFYQRERIFLDDWSSQNQKSLIRIDINFMNKLYLLYWNIYRILRRNHHSEQWKCSSTNVSTLLQFC